MADILRPHDEADEDVIAVARLVPDDLEVDEHGVAGEEGVAAVPGGVAECHVDERDAAVAGDERVLLSLLRLRQPTVLVLDIELAIAVEDLDRRPAASDLAVHEQDGAVAEIVH